MGRNFCCGIAKIIIIKNVANEENEIILKRIGKNINLKIYNILYAEKYIVLNMKDEILEQNIYEFIKEQSKYFDLKSQKHIENDIKQLKEIEYNKLIKNNKLSTIKFKRGNEFCNDISYVDEERKSIMYCDIITYASIKNVFMKNDYMLFSYLRNCIINASDNIIKTSVVVTLM